MPHKTYTTSEVAEFCDVYASTVNNWIKDGRLKAFSTPGGHNRVPKDNLLVFLKEYKVPMPAEFKEAPVCPHVLLVDDEPGMIGMLEHAFSIYPGIFTVDSRLNGYAALMAIGSRKPSLVVLDILMPELDGWGVIDHMKASPETRDIKFIVLSGQKPKPAPETLAAHKVDAFFEKPFDTIQFLNTAAELAGVKLPDTPR